MRYLLVPLSLWLMCCFAAPAQAVEQLVDFGFDQNFPPQTFVQNKQPTGFAVDILYAVLTGTEFRLMAEPGKWADVQRNLAAGTIDVSAGMGKTLEREKLYLFPAFPYDRFDAVVIVPEKSAVKSRTDLKGLTVATQKGSLYQQILERIGNISIKLYPSEAEALIAMTRGKADAFCGAEKTALYNIKQKKISKLRFLNTPLYSDLLYFPVATQRPELAEAISEGMERILKSGVYDKLYARWFGQTDIDEHQALVKAGMKAKEQ